jgi:hypothetical protein
MPNYIIDGSINFYEELLKTDTEDKVDENNLCLLSNLPLDETSITLPCNHKFNYIYIFNEIKNLKKNNVLSMSYLYLKPLLPNEIRCPYCRQTFKSLLPPCKHIKGASILKNVNSIYSWSSLSVNCKEKSSECNSAVYVTNLGYYCNIHYKNKQTNNKNKQIVYNKKINKQTNNKNINISNENKCFDSSFNTFNFDTFIDSSNNIIINNVMVNSELMDISQLEYYINKNYTIPQLKDIINKYNLTFASTSKTRIRVGGSKPELIKRIIAYEMIPLT